VKTISGRSANESRNCPLARTGLAGKSPGRTGQRERERIVLPRSKWARAKPPTVGAKAMMTIMMMMGAREMFHLSLLTVAYTRLQCRVRERERGGHIITPDAIWALTAAAL